MLKPDLVDTLLSPQGEPLLSFLRDAFYADTQRGGLRVDESHDLHRLATLATDLGLLEPRSSGDARLTSLGYELGNVGKEYCNWLDTGRSLPGPLRPEHVAGRRVLDVGCGFGRFPITFARHGAEVFGVDLQSRYLSLSRVFAQREEVRPPTVAVARAEALPFPDEAFDVVHCRLVLNYVDMKVAIREMRRVLVPGGRLFLTMVTLGNVLHDLSRMSWWSNRRGVAWRLFAIANTLCLQTTGRQVRLSARGRMHESHSPTYPTQAWMRRTLRRAGFRIETDSAGVFQAVRTDAVAS
jgi:ubiquinone/menaquinone biosynthesis C-methylase UbiE